MPALAVLVVALAPALWSWWTGRSLIRQADDPAFPELHLARHQKGTVVLATGLALLIVLGGVHGVWAIPLLLLASAAARYPFRKALYGETWGFGAYLRHTVFGTIGGAGFWLLLAFGPALVVAMANGSAPAAAACSVAVGVLLVALERWFVPLWLHVFGARPVGRPDLEARFDAIARQASAAPFRTVRVGIPGSYSMNAAALPSVHGSVVAMGHTLLETLEPDETAAIFAHEVAHLEHFDARRLRRLALLSRALIAGAAVLPALLVALLPEYAHWLAWGWAPVVLIALARRMGDAQKHETESDRRAARLCGDADAVARALTKLHVLSRIPRRWASEYERRATHPSLMRRIQALRALDPADPSAAPAAPAEPSAPTPEGLPALLRSTRPGTYVVLDEARAHWLEGVEEPLSALGTRHSAESPEGRVPSAENLVSLRDRASSYRAVAYRDLAELRVDARGRERALHASDRAGHAWSVPLVPDDVAAAQRALDVIDVRLGTGTARSPLAGAPAYAAALLLFLAATIGGRLGLYTIPFVFALLKPGPTILAGTGAIATWLGVAAALGEMPAPAGPVQAGAIAFLALIGAVVAWTTLRRPAPEHAPSLHAPAQRPAPALVALGVVAAAYLAVVVLWLARTPSLAMGGPPATPALAAALVGLGAALATLPRRRRAGLALAGLAAALGVASLLGARRGGATPDIAWSEAAAHEEARETFRGTVARLSLSPSGSGWALRESRVPDGDTDAGEAEAMMASVRWTVGRFGGTRRSLRGADIAWADDARVLAILERDDDSLEVRAEDAERGDTLWRLALPLVHGADLVASPGRGEWVVTGRSADGDSIVVLRGAVGADRWSRAAWPDDETPGRAAVTFPDGSALVTSFARPLPGPLGFLSFLGAGPLHWEVWHVGPAGRRRLTTVSGLLDCAADAGDSTGALCVEQGLGAGTAWRVSPGGAMSRAASLDADYGVRRAGPDGRIALGALGESRAAVLDPRTATALRLTLPPATERYITDVAAAGDRVATLSTGREGATLTLYRTSGAR